jgi:hypothetical protein
MKAATDDLKEIYDAFLFKLGTASEQGQAGMNVVIFVLLVKLFVTHADLSYIQDLVSLLRASVQVALDMIVFPTSVEAGAAITSLPAFDLGPLSSLIAFVAQSDVADQDTLPVYAVYLQLRASEARCAILKRCIGITR